MNDLAPGIDLKHNSSTDKDILVTLAGGILSYFL